MRVLREPYSDCDRQWDFTVIECVPRSLGLGKRTTERIMIHADLDKLRCGGQARALPLLEVDVESATHGPCLSFQGGIQKKQKKMITQ
jgi:hypothetical protein